LVSDYNNESHNHHIVCRICGAVECVEVEKDWHKIEHKIIQESGYLVEKHALEFFGICPQCWGDMGK